MKYHALFVIFEKAANFEIVVFGALRVSKGSTTYNTVKIRAVDYKRWGKGFNMMNGLEASRGYRRSIHSD